MRALMAPQTLEPRQTDRAYSVEGSTQRRHHRRMYPVSFAALSGHVHGKNRPSMLGATPGATRRVVSVPAINAAATPSQKIS